MKSWVCIVLGFLCVSAAVAERTFVHPGIWHKRSDLDRMKHMVAAGVDPWAASFEALSANSSASYDYVVRKDPDDHTLSRENPRHQRNQYESDAIAAYHNSLMWYITGDKRHAEKTIEILNAWSELTSFYGGGTEPLCAGLYGAPLINAAEIIKSTYDGWAAEDIEAFKDMLVYPGYSNKRVPQNDIDNDNVTFYWRCYQGDPGRHGNQGLLAWRTVMAIGIFSDNEIIYDRAFRQIQGLPHREDDLPYPSGPPNIDKRPNDSSNEYYEEFTVRGRQTKIDDYGYDDQIQHYIYDNGQCQESSRDQVHSSLGVGAVTEMMETAWNQGDDLYSFLDYRVLKGLEFTLKYNLSIVQSYPDQPKPWEPDNYYQIHTRCGRWKSLKINPWVGGNLERNSRGFGVVSRPVLEMPAAHFTVRENMADQATWLLRARDFSVSTNGYEKGNGTDHPGWGGLTYRRPKYCAGDPVSGFENGTPVFAMPVLPAVIEAEHFDHFAGTAQGRTYHDTTPAGAGSGYRGAEGVDIATLPDGGHVLKALHPGEWLSYIFAAPAATTYDIAIRYAAVKPGAKVIVGIDGEDKSGAVEIPYEESDQQLNWQEVTVASDVFLTNRVQNLKLGIGGTPNAFVIDKLIITSGNWIAQTVSAPRTTTYRLAVRYKAAKAGGQIQCNRGDKPLVDAVEVPCDEPGAVQELVIAEKVPFERGIHSLTFNMEGAEDAFVVESVSLVPNDDGLVAHWKFDGEDKAAAADSSGNGFDGEIAGAYRVSGIDGGALAFNGSSSTVTLPPAAFADINSEVTISMWVYGDAKQPLADTIFYATDDNNRRLLNIHLPHEDGTVYWDAGDVERYDRVYRKAEKEQFEGAWNHWAFTKDATSGVMKIYHNGKVWVHNGGRPRVIAPITAASLGSQLSSAHYRGKVDDVRLFKVALSDAEIEALYREVAE